ncbi:hypothetical protein RFI_25594, partial [Reticulomyxa filosa]
GGCGYASGGGGYGTKGGEEDVLSDDGRGGGMYGEETLLKEIHFGSGGGRTSLISRGGSGGGIIELIIGQQLINYGLIQSNGGDGGYSGGGGGSGGSILIELQNHKFIQIFGTIKCIGGNQCQMNEGGKGRIAIYGIELSPDKIKDIDPKPFNKIHKT